MKRNRFSIILVCISILLFITYFIWSFTIPFDGAPDEYLRYQIPKFIFNHGTLPTGFDAETVFNRGYWSYGFYPQFLGPLVSALFMKCVSFFSHNDFVLLIAARLTSMISGVATAFVLGLSVERLTNSRAFRLFSMVFIGLWPQVIFLSSYVNNDIIGLFGVALLVDVIVKTSKAQSWSYKDSLYLAAGFVVCLLSYLNTYGFVLFAGCYFLLVSFKSQKGYTDRYIRVANHFLLITNIVLLFTAPFFLRNYFLYGDLFGNTIFEKVHQQWINQGGERMLNGAIINGWTFREFLDWQPFHTTTWESFIGKFGYMDIALSDVLYHAYSYLLVIGVVVGVLISLKKIRNIWEMIGWSMLVLSSILTIFLHYYRSYAIDYQAQGRYIIGIIIPMVLLMSVGYWKLSNHFRKNKNILLFFFSSIYIASSIYIYYKYVYYSYIVLDIVSKKL